MTIIMIAPTPFFADRGCHTRIYGQISALQRMGYKIKLVTYGLGREIDGVETIRCFNFPWYRKLSAGPSIWKIFLLPFIAFKAKKVISVYKPDIVYAYLHEGACVAKFCSFFHKDPLYVFDCQGSLSGEIVQHKFVKEGGIFHKLFYRLERKIDGWFPVVTQSENLYLQLSHMGVPEGRMINALDAVDTDLFAPRMPDMKLAEKYHINVSEPRVLFMGLLEEYQGVDLMFEAFRYVCGQIPKVQFIVIGYPNIEKYQQLAEDLGIAKNVIFVGKIRFEETPRWLSLSSVAVAPKISTSEGDGKIYNYMAMQMGVVCFDRQISREIMGDTGIFAELKNPRDMADKIIMLLNDRTLTERLGREARLRAEQELSTDLSAQKIDRFFRALAPEKYR